MLKILIVEDEESLRSVTQDALHNLLGYEVYAAITGEEAANILKTKEVDLIILDVGLPDCNGFDIIRSARNQGIAPEVIVVTGFFDGKAQDEAAQLDLKHFMIKPLSLEQLNAKIKELFPAQAKDFPKGIFDFE